MHTQTHRTMRSSQIVRWRCTRVRRDRREGASSIACASLVLSWRSKRCRLPGKAHVTGASLERRQISQTAADFATCAWTARKARHFDPPPMERRREDVSGFFVEDRLVKGSQGLCSMEPKQDSALVFRARPSHRVRYDACPDHQLMQQ